MSHKTEIELEENIPLQPKGWDFTAETTYPFAHLTDHKKSFFVPLDEAADDDDEEIKRKEGILRRKIYARATYLGIGIEVRRGVNKAGQKGLRVHLRRK